MKNEGNPSFLFLIREIWKGNGLWRALMHSHMSRLDFKGIVYDLGSGTKQDYFSYVTRAEKIKLKNFDQKGTKDTPPVNVEKDPIPEADNSADMVLMSNILEHIYNYDFSLKEAYRVLKPGGRLVGFVPFFCHYHPGPHDYFRYTDEALKIMFLNAGFKKNEERYKIEPLGFGPCTVSYHCVFYLAFPKRARRRIKLIAFAIMPIALFGDWLMRKIYPNLKRDFPLGYAFEIEK